MPKAFPIEFGNDVVAVARKREASLSQIAKDFGISESCLHRWMHLADVEDGAAPGVTEAESAELRYPLVLDLADDGIPVAVTGRVLGFSKQAFYAWKRKPASDRDWDDAHLINAAYDIHHDDPEFGYRFIADELPARGIVAGENRVARLCSRQQIWSLHAKKRGLNRKAGPPVHDDLIDRHFTAECRWWGVVPALDSTRTRRGRAGGCPSGARQQLALQRREEALGHGVAAATRSAEIAGAQSVPSGVVNMSASG